MKATVAYLGALGREHRHPRHAIPPLRAAYAASVLRAAGHDVELLDTAAPNAARLDLAAHITRRRPDLLVADARIETVDQVATLARAVRAHCGAIIAAGPPAEALAADVLAEESVRGVLGGEYEGWIGGVAESLAAGAPPLAPGWVTRGASGPFTAQAAVPIADIDALPTPAHAELLAGGYTVAYPVQRRDRLRCAYVLSTRGCPHACTFCSPVEMRSRFLPYRVRDVEAVADELAQVARLGANVVYFNDDNFLRDRARVTALCEAILRRRLDLTWLADARADDVDPTLLPLMRRAGCSTLCLGVESGSQRVLDAMRKGITVEQTRAAAAAIHAAGLWMVAYVILGSPGETEAERHATWRLLDDIRPELVQCHRFAWYPMARGERGDPSWRRPSHKFATDSTGAPPLAFDQRELYRRFYLSPRFLLHYARTRARWLPGPILRDAALAWRTATYLLGAR
ncbi:MAG: B12-binding domain-containing radical SAM protein [Deltaproteobacteria bacterium]|nr:B12-binding domain-containing radical SAM protein [Deltaproteobacteria bacterium]